MGREIGTAQTVTALRDIDPAQGTAVVEGVIFKIDFRVIKSKNFLMTLLLTDNTTTICTKAFVSETKRGEIEEHLHPGDPIRLRGEVQWDTFETSM